MGVKKDWFSDSYDIPKKFDKMKLLYLTSALVSADILDIIGLQLGEDFATNLGLHGCHCKKLANFEKDNVGGSPIDDLDRLCRDFFAAKSCMSLIDGKCQNIDISPIED